MLSVVYIVDTVCEYIQSRPQSYASMPSAADDRPVLHCLPPSSSTATTRTLTSLIPARRQPTSSLLPLVPSSHFPSAPVPESRSVSLGGSLERLIGTNGSTGSPHGSSPNAPGKPLGGEKTANNNSRVADGRPPARRQQQQPAGPPPPLGPPPAPPLQTGLLAAIAPQVCTIQYSVFKGLIVHLQYFSNCYVDISMCIKPGAVGTVHL